MTKIQWIVRNNSEDTIVWTCPSSTGDTQVVSRLCDIAILAETNTVYIRARAARQV